MTGPPLRIKRPETATRDPPGTLARATRQGTQGVAPVIHGQVGAGDQDRCSRRPAAMPGDRTSKLVMRVRSPSSALLAPLQVKGVIRCFSLYLYDARSVVKANALQADNGQGRETSDGSRPRLLSGPCPLASNERIPDGIANHAERGGSAGHRHKEYEDWSADRVGSL
jgi:hypothetical protein